MAIDHRVRSLRCTAEFNDEYPRNLLVWNVHIDRTFQNLLQLATHIGGVLQSSSPLTMHVDKKCKIHCKGSCSWIQILHNLLELTVCVNGVKTKSITADKCRLIGLLENLLSLQMNIDQNLLSTLFLAVDTDGKMWNLSPLTMDIDSSTTCFFVAAIDHHVFCSKYGIYHIRTKTRSRPYNYHVLQRKETPVEKVCDVGVCVSQ